MQFNLHLLAAFAGATGALAASTTHTTSKVAATTTASANLPLITLKNGTIIEDFSSGHPDLSGTGKSHGVLSTQIDCGNRPSFLSEDDCNYMSNIGIAGAGWGTGTISLDNIGSLNFNMVNSANTPMIVMVWDNLFLSANAPALSFSLAAGASQRVYVNGIQGVGGFGAIYNHGNTLSNAGNLWNTIGEFSTDPTYHTFDVSRITDMGGSWMQIVGDNGCNSEWADNFSQCCFTCSKIETPDYNSCGNDGSYWLDNCYSSNNPGAGSDTDLKNGGCQGWTGASVYFL